MRAYRVEKIVSQDGVLELQALPFRAGEVVEVIILSREDKVRGAHDFPLKGKVLRYEGYPLKAGHCYTTMVSGL
jgi:hypothetical protein